MGWQFFISTAVKIIFSPHLPNIPQFEEKENEDDDGLGWLVSTQKWTMEKTMTKTKMMMDWVGWWLLIHLNRVNGKDKYKDNDNYNDKLLRQ